MRSSLVDRAFSSNICRRRWISAVLLGVTIGLGLATRSQPDSFPNLVRIYGGDTLWSACVFFAIGFVWRRGPTGRVAILALLVSYCVEFSQFYHAPWIDRIRDNRIAALILGHHFVVSDLACYTIGVGIGVTVEYFVHRSDCGRSHLEEN